MTGQLGVIDREQGLGDISFRDIAAEPIRAQQPFVTRLGINHVGVDVGVGVNITQDPHEHRAPRVHGGLFGRNAPAVDETLNKRVIGGDLF